jgi:hypothetical protein
MSEDSAAEVTGLGVEISDLLVRQITRLIQETANVAVGDDPKKALETEAYFYRLIAANCEAKAKLADLLSNPTEHMTANVKREHDRSQNDEAKRKAEHARMKS